MRTVVSTSPEEVTLQIPAISRTSGPMVSPKGRPGELRRDWLNRQFCAIGFSACVLCGAQAHAQLTWGLGGNGGSGTWDPSTTADWWNGTSNVIWSANSDAIFAGTGGTVTSTFPGPAANSLTFNSPGYTIQSGWISSAAANFNIVTNQAATIKFHPGSIRHFHQQCRLGEKWRGHPDGVGHEFFSTTSGSIKASISSAAIPRCFSRMSRWPTARMR